MKGKKTGIALLAALCMLLSACGGGEKAPEAPELMEPVGVELDFALVKRMDIENIVTFEACVIPETEDLYFTVDGVIGEVNTRLGASVKKGDVLLKLDEEASEEKLADLREQLAYYETLYTYENDLARVDIDILKLELEKAVRGGITEADRLSSQGNIDMQELLLKQKKEEQDAVLSGIRGDIAELEKDLGKNVITAPFDGTVVRMNTLYEGSWVGAYDEVIRIANEDVLMVESEYVSPTRLSAAPRVYALIRGGTYDLEPVEMDMTEYFSIVFAGGTVMTDLRFTGDAGDIRAGDYALMCLVTSEKEDVLAIPFNALYVDDTGKYVYKLSNGVRIRQNVRTGASNGLYIQVTEGLEEGDRVYVKE